MSFVYGGVQTDDLAGVTATLVAWPSLGGLEVDSFEAPGVDGRSFAGASRSHATFVFDVLIQGRTPQEAASRRDNFIGLLDPSRGPRNMVVETDTAWLWRDVLVSSAIEWERVGWDTGTGFTLRAEVSFETFGDPSAREVSPEVISFTAPRSYTLTKGNTVAFPRLEFPTGAAAVVRIGSFVLNLAATSGGTVVLDWETFEFFVRNSAGARISSVVRHMNIYDRPALELGAAVNVSVKRGATDVAAKLFPNARRI